MNNKGATSAEQYAQHEESVNYVNNYHKQDNNLYSNSYNHGWKNHPNFGWKNNQGAGPHDRPHPLSGFQQRQRDTNHQSQPSIEDLVLQMANHNMENAKNIARLEALVQSQAASLKLLENQFV